MKKENIKYVEENTIRTIDLLKNSRIKDKVSHTLEAFKEFYSESLPKVCFIPVRSRQIQLWVHDLEKMQDKLKVDILSGLDDFMDETDRDPLILAKQSIQNSDFVVTLMQAFQLFPDSLMKIIKYSKEWRKPIGIVITGLERISEQEQFIEEKRRKIEIEIGEPLKKLLFISSQPHAMKAAVHPKKALDDIVGYIEEHKVKLKENKILQHIIKNLTSAKSKLVEEIDEMRKYKQRIHSERELLQGAFQVNEIISKKISMFLNQLQEKIEYKLNQLNWALLQNEIIQTYGEIPKDDTFNRVFKDSLDDWKLSHLEPCLENGKKQFLMDLKSTASQATAEFRTYIDYGLSDSSFSMYYERLKEIKNDRNWSDNTEYLAEAKLSDFTKMIDKFFIEKAAMIANDSVIKILNILRSSDFRLQEEEELYTDKNHQNNRKNEEHQADNNNKQKDRKESENYPDKSKEKGKQDIDDAKSQFKEISLKYLHLIPDKMFENTMENIVFDLKTNLRLEIELFLSNAKQNIENSFMADLENYYRIISNIFIRVTSIINEVFKSINEASNKMDEIVEWCNSNK